MPVRVVTAEELRVRTARRIRDLAARRRISLTKLAAESGVSRKHLQAILAGTVSPSLDVVAKLAGALRVDPMEILRPPKP